MRKIKDTIQRFYVERIWDDGDIDYFKVLSKDNREYIFDNPYIRCNDDLCYVITSDETRVYIGGSGFNFKDNIITKEKFDQIKNLL